MRRVPSTRSVRSGRSPRGGGSARAAAALLTLGSLLTAAVVGSPSSTATAGSLPAGSVPATGQPEGRAPGAPGTASHFGLARKDCIGTARNRTSKVWFTVAGGALSDVHHPTIDTTNVETLQFVVTDGATFTDLSTRDTTYTVRALDRSGMACRVTSTARNGRYTLVTDYLTDPARNAVVLRVALTPTRAGDDLDLYVRLDPTVNGNGGGGSGNAGADDAAVDTSTGAPVPVASDPVTATTAANRDYARPVHLALRADRPFPAASVGYAGTESDGLTALDAGHRLTPTHAAAEDGNAVLTARVRLHGPGHRAVLALGFGETRAEAVRVAGAGASADPEATLRRYLAGWRAYDAGLRPMSGLHLVSANVLKAAEDKTFPGAVVASPTSPWGQAVTAGDPALTYFGSYREVFARDLYETFTGLLAAGDPATARDTVRFLFERQQQPDGSFPRNSLINGATAPDSFGVQLDEVAYPILMARTIGLTDAATYTDHVRRAADFLVAHGPAFGSERWEEQSGWSPSTIAAEIAGLTAAGWIAERNGDDARARIYRAVADHYQRNVKRWTLTTTGPLSEEPYFLRLSKNADPDSAFTYNLGNGGPDADQRAVVDAGFLELPRLGILADDDPDVVRSLDVVDRVIRRPLTPTASVDGRYGFYRYGTASEGTEDGYGACWTGDPTDCTVEGKPWAGVCETKAQNHGSGHLWPALAGERGEHELASGRAGTARQLLAGMAGTASGIGLIPEQAWENPDLPPSPSGTPPECASIGFSLGKAAGSASPLTWSAAQYVRLATALADHRVPRRPADTTARYLDGAPERVDLALTAPADGSVVERTVAVAGTTEPGATVDVSAVNVDLDGAATVTTTTAGEDGAFSVEVEVPPGTAELTATASGPGAEPATGFAQRSVVNDVVPGTLLFAATDPDGDDDGPGSYAYPTAGDFHPGAFDLQAFEVYDSGPDTVTFRVRTRDLSPTFGSALGAQLVDVHVASPTGGETSTAASFAQRNYRIADPAAWNRLIEVQGFGQRFVDGSGATVGSVTIRGNQLTRWITFTVTKAALGGTPGSGWTFAVVLTGQDGFSPDQARGFAATAQPYQFGVCTAAAVAAGDPVCAVDPGAVPKALDVLTPAGVAQAEVLDPVGHDPATDPVTVPGITVP